VACLKTNKMEEDNLKEFKARILALLIGISLIGGFGSFLFFTYNFLQLVF